MNKLEEYKRQGENDYALGYCESSPEEANAAESGYSAGFDAAIALNLAVKFNLWIQSMEEDKIHNPDFDTWVLTPEWTDIDKNVTTKQLYEYWLKKFYKPE